MMTLSNGNISAFLVLCAGNSAVNGEFPAQVPVTQSFDVFFDLRQNKRLNKQYRRRWFEMPSRSFWHHCNVNHSHGFVVLCFVVDMIITISCEFKWFVYPHSSSLIHWYCGNRKVAHGILIVLVPVKWPWGIWVILVDTHITVTS